MILWDFEFEYWKFKEGVIYSEYKYILKVNFKIWIVY